MIPIVIYKRLFLVLGLTCALCFLMTGVALGQQGTWTDEISNSITMYKSLYPTSNFTSYEAQLMKVKEAVSKGDQQGVRKGMKKWFKMLRNRDHGIDAIAADELFNFGVMVTPVQEYNISVPRR